MKCLKNTRTRLLVVFIFILVLALLFQSFPVLSLSKYGSTGEEVKAIQTKLNELGYFDGEIDGIFGSKT
ncbi:MAG: peptidoglycan-binding domain-containing protein, partial [Acutalibacteraceae bacterium]|nr:peptidoglycan-binding domain-containing protein [Acutalibacteraceae bacterium]